MESPPHIHPTSRWPKNSSSPIPVESSLLAPQIQTSSSSSKVSPSLPVYNHLLTSKALTGSLPLTTGASPAGLSHSLHLKTTYYTVDIPIWIDEIEPVKEAEWAAGYLNNEAKEVLKVLGGFILTFRKPQDEAGLVRYPAPISPPPV